SCFFFFLFYFFFFSSRRRHTISKRDWSSDVCSSDLILILVRRLKISGVWSSLVAVVFLITLLLFSYLAISLFHMWVPMGDSLVIAFFFLFVYGLMTAHYDVVEANRRLEERVALRTQELEETNKNLAQ